MLRVQHFLHTDKPVVPAAAQLCVWRAQRQTEQQAPSSRQAWRTSRRPPSGSWSAQRLELTKNLTNNSWKGVKWLWNLNYEIWERDSSTAVNQQQLYSAEPRNKRPLELVKLLSQDNLAQDFIWGSGFFLPYLNHSTLFSYTEFPVSLYYILLTSSLPQFGNSFLASFWFFNSIISACEKPSLRCDWDP